MSYTERMTELERALAGAPFGGFYCSTCHRVLSGDDAYVDEEWRCRRCGTAVVPLAQARRELVTLRAWAAAG